MKNKALDKEVGKAIAEQRRALGLTQAEVACELDIETETLSRFENGIVSVTLCRLEQISRLFKCSMNDFLPDQEKHEAYESTLQKLAFNLDSLKSEEKEALILFLTESTKLLKKLFKE